MKIINLTYRRFFIQDLTQWIRGFRLYYGIWEEMARRHDVRYYHFSHQQTTITENGVRHCFIKASDKALKLPFSLHQRIRTAGPDVVIVHGMMYPWQILLLSLQVHDARIWVQHHAELPVRHPIKKWLQKRADRKIQGYFFTGKDLAQPWLAAGLIKKPEKIFELMEVSSVFEKQKKSECREKLNIQSNQSILWVGHLNENKNPLLAASAFLKLQERQSFDADLYFIFQTDQLLDELKQLLQKSPLASKRIHLIGKVAHEAMQDWYSAVDFIFSTSNYEGSGTAVCEAMSCGCVPVLSDIPSFRFMAGGSGFLAKKGDEQSFTEALKTALAADYEGERKRVLDRYQQALSFEAIAWELERALRCGV